MSAQDTPRDPSLEPETPETPEAAEAASPASGPDDPSRREDPAPAGPDGPDAAPVPGPAGPAGAAGSDDPSQAPVPGPGEADEASPPPAVAEESMPMEAAPAGEGGKGPDAAAGDGQDGDGLPEMGLLDHLNDLRKRLSRSALAVLVGFLACYAFAEDIFNFLLAPLRPHLPEGSGLIFTSPPEAFFTYMLAAAVAGLFLMSPFVFYQIWQFIAPGLYQHERKWIIPIALCSALFFATGACFAYYMVFPVAFEFFMSYAKDLIQAQLKMSEYFSFTLKLMVAFGIAFELPLFVFFLARLGMVTAKSLRKFRQYAILLIFITAAILTPPDVVSQLSMAGPLLVLYELSIWVAHFFSTRKDEPGEEKPAAAAEEKSG